MNEYMLDTHVVLWWFFNDGRLPYRMRHLIRSADNRLWMSAGSAWEISTKSRLGRLPRAATLVTDLPRLLSRSRIEVIAIELEDALIAGALDHQHPDPFDRMIAAQGMRREMTVITNDAAIEALGASVLW